MKITGDFERSQDVVFEKSFLKYEFLKKESAVPFLVESTAIEVVTFPYKTALSKASIKTSIIRSTKYSYHKEQNFTTNDYISFLKI